MSDTPVAVNGIVYDFATIKLMLDGDLYISVKAINYGDTCEPGKLRGTSPQALGRTTGDYDATASLELSKGAFRELIAKLGDGFMAKTFDCVVNFQPPGGLPIITDKVIGCRISKNDAAHSQGTDALTMKIDLSPHKCTWDGYDPLPDMF